MRDVCADVYQPLSNPKTIDASISCIVYVFSKTISYKIVQIELEKLPLFTQKNDNEGQGLNRLRNNATLAFPGRLFRDSSLKFLRCLQEVNLDFFFNLLFSILMTLKKKKENEGNLAKN